MIKCEDCKEVFHDYELEEGSKNYVPFHDDWVVESENSRCPYCGSEEVREVEAQACTECGEVYAEEDMKFTTEGWLCKDCMEADDDK